MIYEKDGVSEYWIIDITNEYFMVYSYDLEKKSYNNTHQEDYKLCSKLFVDLKIDGEL